MKTNFLVTTLTTLAVSLFNVAQAQPVAAQGIVTAVVGGANVRLANGSTFPASVGMKLSAGAAITTGTDSKLSLQVHPGIVAIVASRSVVEVEELSVSANGTRNAMLSVKSGTLASSLDSALKGVTNYGVRTAKGVAMAHGTTMTVSVNGNTYTVSVLAGNVTVNWAGGLSVSISGNTPAGVTTNSDGQVSTVSLASALAAGGSTGLTEALTAAAAAVATVATNTTQITAVINTIAAAAGSSSTASATVASATAAATGAAVGNPTLVATAGGNTTAVASTISTAAVTSATAAGNPSAAALIVTSAVAAVNQTIPGTNVNAVAAALTSASNNVPGNTPVNAGLVTAGVTAAQNPPTTTERPLANDTTTPVTPINPALVINVSRSS